MIKKTAKTVVVVAVKINNVTYHVFVKKLTLIDFCLINVIY